MEDTDFYVPKEKFNRIGAVYAPDSVGIKIIMEPDTNTVSIPVKFLSGNGDKTTINSIHFYTGKIAG